MANPILVRFSRIRGGPVFFSSEMAIVPPTKSILVLKNEKGSPDTLLEVCEQVFTFNGHNGELVSVECLVREVK